jgi:NAD(P)-dependent dehydrogenase (short-subunit alcohol dehydrogenase family)
MSSLLEGRVAIVTGAGHGIGRGHALELAKHGATVVVNDLGTSVRGEGEGRDAAIWNMPAEDFDLVMRVHVRGTWLISRAAARQWRAQAKANGGQVYGRIINTTSGAGLLGNFGQTNYATAKAAIVGMTLTLNIELAGIGVTANVIGPGGLTRLSATMPGMPDPVEADERAEEDFDPLDPSLCSPVVAWLASPEAGHVSGQVIRAMDERIILMNGWTEERVVRSAGKRWDATKLGALFATDVFETRARGLRMG